MFDEPSIWLRINVQAFCLMFSPSGSIEALTGSQQAGIKCKLTLLHIEQPTMFEITNYNEGEKKAAKGADAWDKLRDLNLEEIHLKA